MKHYVYKMTNELNGWVYIGQHYQTEVDPLEDGYVGSGSYWKREVLNKKLPIKKEILAKDLSINEANNLETFYIRRYKNAGAMMYNVAPGGGNKERMKEVMHWNDTLKCWDRYWVFYH